MPTSEIYLHIESLLNRFGIKSYDVTSLLPDASKRQYFRVSTMDSRYIVMDSSRDMNSLKAFLHVGAYITEHGLGAPKVLASDFGNGLLLLEDFGNTSYTNFLQSHPNREIELYSAAVDVLAHLQKLNTTINVGKQDRGLLHKGLQVFANNYLFKTLPTAACKAMSQELYDTFDKLYTSLEQQHAVLVLRDFHADNLMWLEGNAGLAKVGLLDFQDAVYGSPTYDLMSLLEDARRDVAQSTVELCKTQFFDTFKNRSKEALELSYILLSIQRNLRIVGTFHALHQENNKSKYMSYLDRVWGYIDNTLKHPALEGLRGILRDAGIDAYHRKQALALQLEGTQASKD